MTVPSFTIKRRASRALRDLNALYSALETIGNQITCERGRDAWTDDRYAEIDAIDRQIDRLQSRKED